MSDIHDRVLDWRPNHDPRSMDPEHRVFPRGAAATPPRLTRHYTVPKPVLDQKAEGACVGHGVVNALPTHPAVRLRVLDPQALAFGMYYGSRRIDEWPGEDYSGTSVNAGMKLARELGLIREWRWCKGADEVRDAILLGQGPVVIGIKWTHAMYQTLGGGVVTDMEQGRANVVGGHCLMVDGYATLATHGSPVPQSFFRWENSWGDSYGVKGKGYVPVDVMTRRLADEGEAAVIVA